MSETDLAWDFFLAHAGADVELAERLFELLADSSRVFLDSRCLQLGDDWDTILADAQRRSLITVVLVSRNTTSAYYQREEVAAAIALAREDGDKHRVVPVYLDSSAEKSVTPYGLRLKHGISIGDTCGLPEAAAELLSLRRSLGEPIHIRKSDSGKDLSTRPVARRERIAVLRWLKRLPDEFESHFRELWRIGIGKHRPPEEEADRLHEQRRGLLRSCTCIEEKLPEMFRQVGPSEQDRALFSEVSPAFKREAEACFHASRTLINGVQLPSTDGSRVPITFSMTYSALEVGEHLRILRMAADELGIRFPVDEVEEAERPIQDQIER
jgi:hypothetical protein